MRERGRGEGIPPQDEPSNRAAWRTQQPSRLADPAITPLGEASVYPAWCVANLKFCTEKSLPPLAGEGGRRPEGGIKNQDLSRLAGPATTPLGGPSNRAAWRTQQPSRLANPATAPLGGPSNHAAWRTQQPRRLAGPATTPLGGPSNYAAYIFRIARSQHSMLI